MALLDVSTELESVGILALSMAEDCELLDPGNLSVLLEALRADEISTLAELRMALCSNAEVVAFLNRVGLSEWFPVLSWMAAEVKRLPVQDLVRSAMGVHATPVPKKRRMRVWAGRLLPEPELEAEKPSQGTLAEAVCDVRKAKAAKRLEAAVAALPPASVWSGDLPPLGKAATVKPERTLAQSEARAKDRAEGVVLGLLVKLGAWCDSCKEVFPSGPEDGPDSERACVFLLLAFGTRSSACVASCAKEAAQCVDWLLAAGCDVESPSLLTIGTYLRLCRQRGKTVPGRVREALVWAEEVYSIKFGATSGALKSLTRKIATQNAKAVVPARCCRLTW